MQTGRAGYFKRINDKANEVKKTAHIADNDTGISKEAVNKSFDHLKKEVIKDNKVSDDDNLALHLPFFASLGIATGSTSSMCAPKTLIPLCDLASGSVPATPADAADASPDLGVEEYPDDGTDEECDAIGSVIAQFGVRMSAKSGKGRSAGVKAAQSKTPTKATGGGLPKQPKPSPTKLVAGKRSNAGPAAVDSAKVSSSMEESDVVSLDDFSSQVHGHTHNMFVTVPILLMQCAMSRRRRRLISQHSPS